MPGPVKTDEELRRIAGVLQPMSYHGDEIDVDFETTWEYARWVLPPCFEPVGDKKKNTARANANIGTLDCAHSGAFDSAEIMLACSYKGVEGAYTLLALHSTEAHVLLARDFWGGPKKLGEARIFHDGSHHYAYGERDRVRLFEIEVDTSGPDRGNEGGSGNVSQMSASVSLTYALKMFPHHSGVGLEYPPKVIEWENRNTFESWKEGTGKLKINKSKWEQTSAMPIVSVGAGRACVFTLSTVPLREEVLEDRDGVYARYMWGLYFEDPTTYEMAPRFDDVPVNDLEVAPVPDVEVGV